MIQGGRPWTVLERLRADYPMAMHGVAMSLSSANGPDPVYLRRLKALADRIQPMWVSDHLCWSEWGDTRLHDLNPVPYTEESARHVIRSIRQAQDVLGRQLVIENVSSYIEFADSACSEWQFLSHVSQEADCLLLLDVNNIYVSCANIGGDPFDYLARLPATAVGEMHLAGHCAKDIDGARLLIDDHGSPVKPAVWSLYERAARLFPHAVTLIEWDSEIPALDVLVGEAAEADRCRETALGGTDARAA